MHKNNVDRHYAIFLFLYLTIKYLIKCIFFDQFSSVKTSNLLDDLKLADSNERLNELIVSCNSESYLFFTLRRLSSSSLYPLTILLMLDKSKSSYSSKSFDSLMQFFLAGPPSYLPFKGGDISDYDVLILQIKSSLSSSFFINNF